MADKSFFEPLVNPQVLERVKQWRKLSSEHNRGIQTKLHL